MTTVNKIESDSPLKINPKQIHEKYCKGDSFSDNEVKSGADFFLKLSDDLFKCGDVFRLAAQEADRVGLGLRQYQKARELR